MKKITIFLDDSGVLSKNAPEKHFVYAGYIFLNDKDKDYAKRRYQQKIQELRELTGREDELKAAHLHLKSKRKLYKIMDPFYSLSAYVNIEKVYLQILGNKLAIHRFKDYVIKMLIKKQINSLIKNELIDAYEDIELKIYIDEQATATNGYYSLKESILEELKYGINNLDYGTRYEPILFGNLIVNVYYYDSKQNYLGQAADILANRIWNSYVKDDLKLRTRPKNFHLQFPK